MSYTLIFELLGALSVITFIGSLLAVPWIIARLPHDYFIRHRIQVEARHKRHPVLALIIFIIRNVIGGLLLVAGIAMLILPGQGILTMIIGISFMDFAGKHTLVDSFVRQPKIVKLLNWIRKKEKKSPFSF
ncbi:MAG: PGPGW domain-containing protein [Desulfobulbaceae bacterium]|nr:PGPGW domain-containing protein [Desulfobulbaceae bacterium]